MATKKPAPAPAPAAPAMAPAAIKPAMKAANLLFSFEDMTAKDKPARELTRVFKRAGVDVVQVDVNPSIKRAAGMPYRELMMTFTDNQQVTLRIKQTGDVYQVLLNGKLFPIKQQDDHVAAMTEVVKAMNAGRAAFQKRLAMVKAKLPPTVRTAAPKILEILTARRDELRALLASIRAEIARVKGT